MGREESFNLKNPQKKFVDLWKENDQDWIEKSYKEQSIEAWFIFPKVSRDFPRVMLLVC